MFLDPLCFRQISVPEDMTSLMVLPLQITLTVHNFPRTQSEEFRFTVLSTDSPKTQDS